MESIVPPEQVKTLPLLDTRQRPLRDLRISVTDRCNFRCTYCMPKEVFGRDWQFLPRPELLSFEEIARVARVFVGLGVEKIRITGGEPLLRRELPRLLAMLAVLPGLKDLTLTTNGTLLQRCAEDLRSAGLRRLTVSLDALDDAVFRTMNDVRVPVTDVLAGIAAAKAAGFAPIKINVVVQRGVNDAGIVDLARYGREHGHIVRFIEYMDVGDSNGWRLQEVVTAQEIHERIDQRWPLEPVAGNYAGEVATRFRYCDGVGEVGIIASVTVPFCGNCTRARLTADGQLYTCLFATQGQDLRTVLRNDPEPDARLDEIVGNIWHRRTDRYSEIRHLNRAPERKVEMSRVGG
jgi:GTP 3',8-cyclase